MDRSRDYTVTVKAVETVVAAPPPAQELRLPLSNFDLILPPLDVGLYLCYRKKPREENTSFATMVAKLKASLAHVLATYYPFAGDKVVADSAGQPELLCNNRGVDFVVACADVELRRLNLHLPNDSVEGKLVPKKNAGVLCVQMTELKCGGVVMACVFDHRIADLHSFNMFLMAWSEHALSKPFSLLPSFDRSPLAPRRPLQHDPFFDRLFVPLPFPSQLPPPPAPPIRPTRLGYFISRIYRIAAKDLVRLQPLNATKIEAFAAYLWVALAKAAAAAAAEEPMATATCRMGMLVNGRGRLGGSDLSSYFGNLLSMPYVALGAEELLRMKTEEVIESVRRWLRREATGEHFQGLIDWVEAHRPRPLVATACFQPEEGGGETCVVVSSWRGLEVAAAEFGWGKPVFGSCHFPSAGSGVGYVGLMESAGGHGDWVIYAHLPEKVAAVLEADHPPVLQAVTPDIN